MTFALLGIDANMTLISAINLFIHTALGAFKKVFPNPNSNKLFLWYVVQWKLKVSRREKGLRGKKLKKRRKRR